ncbi:MAG TPA: MBL fold metallo-hydrolase [Kofleriaceae bacterium]|nr:MBL fold metallo-hydrolase [Kofleriaceae bacterium]
MSPAASDASGGVSQSVPGSSTNRVLPPGGPSVTWLGHATAVGDFGSARVVFDPLLRARARAAGKVDAVLVTHSHVDHLNRWSLKAIDRATHLVVPKGSRDVVADLGFAQVTEVEAGDQVQIAGLEITAVETRHDNGRWRKSTMPIALGYVVSGGGATIHHAGDVDFSDHAVFDAIGKRFSIDAALLPIGGMMPVWYYRWRRAALDRGIHIDPDCALDIYERLGATSLVPVHWGTVNLRLGPPSMPRRRLAKIALARGLAGVEVLAHGQSLPLTSRR